MTVEGGGGAVRPWEGTPSMSIRPSSITIVDGRNRKPPAYVPPKFDFTNPAVLKARREAQRVSGGAFSDDEDRLLEASERYFVKKEAADGTVSLGDSLCRGDCCEKPLTEVVALVGSTYAKVTLYSCVAGSGDLKDLIERYAQRARDLGIAQ